ncbi:MAG TPA: hypothetical protein VNI82_00035 [Candidatus Nitrosotenuis sp.]|nr:hypothetical protein [Candidatus Nitrosotenuis sp.]
MKSIIKKIAQGLLLVPVLALGLSVIAPVAQPVDAFNQSISEGVDASRGQDQPAGLFEPDGIFQTVTNILLFIVGAIAVIMLIIGGIRYVVSGGDQSAVTAAKNTILYAIVGIVVAILAYAAVQFVTNALIQP